MKVKAVEANKFLQCWHSDGYKSQRLGQAFCNEFNISHSIMETKLFYLEDKKAAIELIFEHFVE
jgi:hypothetical protein